MQLRSEKWVFPVFDIHDLFQNDRTFEEECNKKYNKSSIPVEALKNAFSNNFLLLKFTISMLIKNQNIF